MASIAPIKLQASLYDREVIEAALYRIAHKASASIQLEADSWIIALSPLDEKLSETDYLHLFQTELLDQSLRAQLEKKTVALKTLILSNAFSRTQLITSNDSASA